MAANLTILFIRHGESYANHEGIFNGQKHDAGLTDLGKKQFVDIGEELMVVPFSQVFCSRLKRCVESAEVIQDICSVPITPTSLLNEVNFGKLDGMPKHHPDYSSQYQHILEHWHNHEFDVAFPEGENYNDIITRFLTFVMKAQHNGDSVIVAVGHTVFMRTVIWGLSANRPQTIDDCFVDNGHMSVLTYNNERNYWQLQIHNAPIDTSIIDQLAIEEL
ncbi:histidine phosphatase family protein [candidate division WWE3 bacterium]|nr:histidine phosphatase family protein [candidate division WWE3 bacterium]